MSTVHPIFNVAWEKERTSFTQGLMKRYGATQLKRTQATRETKMELLLMGAHKIPMNIDPEEIGMELWQLDQTLYVLDTWLM